MVRPHPNPVIVLLGLGAASTIAIAWLTPPYQAPDEQDHLYRAYQISRGELRSHSVDGRVGTWLPESLPDSAAPYLRLRRHPERKLDAAPGAGWAAPLDPTRERFVGFETTALYPPVPYLPQAAAIALGRAFDLGPIALLHLARLANLSVALSLLALALVAAPMLRWPLLLLFLSPMSSFIMASASADAFTNAAAALFFALALRAMLGSGEFPLAERASLFAVGLALALSKPAYGLLLGLVLLIPAARFPSPLARWRFSIALLASCAAALASWAAATRGFYGTPEWLVGVDPAAQARFLIADPLRGLSLLLAQLLGSAPRFVEFTLGSRLGSLDVGVPLWLIRAYPLCLLASLAFEWRTLQRLPRGTALLSLAIVSATAAGIWLLIYLGGTPVGADRALGIQGRYFIPLTPLLLLVIASALARLTPPAYAAGARATAAWAWTCVAFLVLSAAVTLHSIATRYYAPGAVE